jgi:DNA-binding LytR/AlgR family response regulator
MLSHWPDLVLVDVDLGSESGFDLVSSSTARPLGSGGKPAIILIVSHAD